MSKNESECPMCDRYDEDNNYCLGYEISDKPGGWCERIPGVCKMDGCPYYEWYRGKAIYNL